MRSLKPPVLLMASTALALLLSGCGPPPTVQTGGPVPSFSLRNLEGERIRSSAFEGRPTLINFWATWCQPCRKEKPELGALAREGTINVVGIALDEKGEATVRPFVEKNQTPYPILLGNKEIFQRFGGYAIPYSLLVDAQGTILEIYRGPITKSRVDKDLEISSTPTSS